MTRKLLIAWLVIGTVLMVVGIAAGGDTGGCTRPNVPVWPVVCRIGVPCSDGTNSWGSGTIVDANPEKGIALVVTAAHVVRGAAGEPKVFFADGTSSGGRVIGTDEAADLAALVVWAPEINPVAVGETVQLGECLSVGGWDSGCWNAFAGPYRQTVHIGPKADVEAVQIDTTVRQGDSGGPIVNAAGEMVGVISLAKTNYTVGCGPGPLRRFLLRFLNRIRTIRDGGNVPAPSLPAPSTSGGASQPLVPIPPAIRPEQEPAQPSSQAVRDTARDAAIEAIERGFADLEDKLANRQPLRSPFADDQTKPLAELAGRLKESLEGTDSLRERLGRLNGLLADVRANGGIGDAAPTVAGILWPSVAAALGLSAPPTAAVTVAWLAVSLLRWRRKRKRKTTGASEATTAQQVSTTTADGKTTVVVDQLPPEPAKTVYAREYVQVAAPSEDLEALRWAMAYHAKQYPGSVSTLKAIESYAAQYKSGQQKQSA